MEDVGVLIPMPPSSPDPLNSINDAFYNIATEDEPYYPVDGPNTRQLRKRLGAGRIGRIADSDDSIEDADGFDNQPPHSKPPSASGSNVKEKILLFEPPPNSVPFIDLRTKQKLAKTMKGKQPIDVNHAVSPLQVSFELTIHLQPSIQTHMNSKQKDPIATSTTNFIGKSTGSILPIEAWCLGSKCLRSDGDQTYSLQLQGQKMTIKNNGSGSALHSLQPSVDRDLDFFEVCSD